MTARKIALGLGIAAIGVSVFGRPAAAARKPAVPAHASVKPASAHKASDAKHPVAVSRPQAAKRSAVVARKTAPKQSMVVSRKPAPKRFVVAARPPAPRPSVPVLRTPAPEQPAVPAYTLLPGDQLDISVADHDELKTSVTVLPDGTITVPQVGIVHAAGLTVDHLTRVVTRKLGKTFIDPDVALIVHSSAVNKVSVLGAVRIAGQYQVTSTTRVMDVLAAAGGLAQDASVTRVSIVSGAHNTIKPVDIVGLMGGTDSSQNVTLVPGDLVLVQALEGGILQVQVTGEVAKPGSYPIPPEGASVVSVLSQAGGQLTDAALSQAQILHDGKARTVDLLSVTRDLNSPATTMLLLPGDVLQIPANRARIAVLGEVRTPGAFEIPDGGSLTTSSAIVMAGGTTGSADTKKATLVRRDATGQMVSSAVDVDGLLRGRKGVQDPDLQPGDVVYIPPKGQKASALSLLPLVSLASLLYR